MELGEIKELLASFDASTLTLLEVTRDGLSLRMQKGDCPASEAPRREAAPTARPGAETSPAAEAPKEQRGGTVVKSPIVGVVYAAQSPSDAPFVTEGQQVKKGQALCLVEAMKMMNEVASPCDGVVKKILFQNGELAQFGDPLVELEPT